jgi:hypothetical protein
LNGRSPPDGVYQAGAAYSAQLGFEIGAHALRATAATNALDHQADIAKVQEWLGHANIATTRIYDHRRTRPEDSPTFNAEQFPAPMYPVRVGVYVTFSDATDAQHSERELSRAFAALAANELLDMVIPATIAIEFSCKRLISDLREKLALIDENVSDKDLLSDVIPFIARAVHVPNLREEILQKMRRLWGQRDKAAHTGHIHQPYTRESAGLQLAAAVFSFRYLALLRSKAEEQGLLNGGL